jgi:hypothetical protein
MQVSLAKTVETLEARRAVLAGELAAIDARLQAIAHAVQGEARAATAAVAQPRAARGASDRRSKRARRSWFALDEAVGLLRKVAKSPKAPAVIVNELGRLKGYNGRLSPEDERRFQGAAYMAIAQALKNKALRRNPKGQVVAA